MEVHFARKRLADTLTQPKLRVREYGDVVATKIVIRINALESAATLEDLRHLAGNYHELHGDRAGQIAVTLTRNLRLVFTPTKQPPPTKADGGMDWSAVTAVTLLEVTDYHGD